MASVLCSFGSRSHGGFLLMLGPGSLQASHATGIAQKNRPPFFPLLRLLAGNVSILKKSLFFLFSFLKSFNFMGARQGQGMSILLPLIVEFN